VFAAMVLLVVAPAGLAGRFPALPAALPAGLLAGRSGALPAAILAGLPDGRFAACLLFCLAGLLRWGSAPRLGRTPILAWRILALLSRCAACSPLRITLFFGFRHGLHIDLLDAQASPRLFAALVLLLHNLHNA
jgi:hypothetical protein